MIGLPFRVRRRFAPALVAGCVVAALASPARASVPPDTLVPPGTALPAGPDELGNEAGCRPGAGDCFSPHGGPGCEWGPCCEVVCAVMPECCSNGWDDLCADLAGDLCERPPACRVALGDCLEPGKEPGCGERSCCALVCAFDPFCCFSRWDSLCADAAAESCGVEPCVLITDAMVDEGEVCGEPINDGCDQPGGFAAGVLAFGDTLSGRTYALERRDVDWYAIQTSSNATLTVQAEFPAEVSIVIGDCESGFTAIASINIPACGEGTIAVPGIGPPSWVVVAPGRGGQPILGGIACAGGPPVRVVQTFGDGYVIRLGPLQAD